MGAMAARLLQSDHDLGMSVQGSAQRSSSTRLLATIASLSGDEAVGMTLPVVLMLSQALLHWGPANTIGVLCEIEGDIFMCSMVETLLKCIVQRTRPTYAKQATFYVLPGEWWSFPSGHTLRAAYLARRLLSAGGIGGSWSLVGGATGGAGVGVHMAAAAWAFSVGWSRIAKGKHYPLDVAAGLLVGGALAEMGVAVGAWRWSAAKVVFGSASSAAVAILAARPEWRPQGYAIHAALQLLWWLMQPYGLGIALTWPAVLLLGLPNLVSFYVLGTRLPASAGAKFAASRAPP